MLKIFRSMKELDFAQLMSVYTETNRISGRERYPDLSENLQLLRTEHDFFGYLRMFFADQNALYAVWMPDGAYMAALRLETYADGILFSGLETAPTARCNGFATQLIRSVLRFLSEQGYSKVYSHVEKKNIASLKVHTACGFVKLLDHAVYSDGSVFHSSCTLCCYL